MLISYEPKGLVKYISRDILSTSRSWSGRQSRAVYKYKIVDSDFVCEDIIEGQYVGSSWILNAVIDTYEKQNLNVAKNCMLALMYMSERSGGKFSIDQLIRWNTDILPKFAQYKENVEKYMVLI
jgi:hypothetical protein